MLEDSVVLVQLPVHERLTLGRFREATAGLGDETEISVIPDPGTCVTQITGLELEWEKSKGAPADFLLIHVRMQQWPGEVLSGYLTEIERALAEEWDEQARGPVSILRQLIDFTED
jgi:hypothetical protein